MSCSTSSCTSRREQHIGRISPPGRARTGPPGLPAWLISAQTASSQSSTGPTGPTWATRGSSSGAMVARGSMSGSRSRLRAPIRICPSFVVDLRGSRGPPTNPCGPRNWLEDEPHSPIILPLPPGLIHEATSIHNASKPRGRTRRGGCFPHIRKTGSQGRTGLPPACQSLRLARPPPAHPSHWPGIEYGPGSSRCFRPLPHGG